MGTPVFSTDQHLGVNLVEGTTPASRMKLQLAMEQAARDVFALAPTLGIADPKHVSLGDLFHKYSNDEVLLARVMDIINAYDYVLEGNHDVKNVADSCSSLAFLMNIRCSLRPHEVMPRNVSVAFGDIGCHGVSYDDVVLFFVPHMATQALFDEALLLATQQAQQAVLGSKKPVLCLHCNYNSPFTNDIALNLPQDKAGELLQVFAYILIGHDHNPKSDFNGRLVVLGNTRPTSFHDITDKFVYWFDRGELRKHQTYFAKDKYIELPWMHIREKLETGELEKYEFIRIIGKAMPSDLLEVSKSMKEIWQKCPELLAMKQDLEVVSIAAVSNHGKVQLQKLEQHIDTELTKSNPELAALFRELAAQVKDKETA